MRLCHWFHKALRCWISILDKETSVVVTAPAYPPSTNSVIT